MKNKYHAKKCVCDGEVFDSLKEMHRYQKLKLLEKAGEIQGLRRQVKFILIPSQRRDGKVVEREVAYKADFVYEENGETVVEDVKGFRTADYKLKRKMMLLFHNIRIKEV
jgi:hypothetical protein